MKKFLSLFLLLMSIFTLTACDLGGLGGLMGSTTEGGQGGSVNKTTTFKKNTLPLYDEDTIKSNIGSYTSNFTITNYSNVYTYKVSYNALTGYYVVTFNSKTVSGDVIHETEEFYLTKSGYREFVVYYENEFGSGYNKDYSLSLLYLTLVYDISSEVLENAPYQSKEEMTYASRDAVKYTITNSEYIIPTDTNLYIILDKETGAVLSLSYDNVSFYESTLFIPNDEEAITKVNSKKNNVDFDFYCTDMIDYVGLTGIEFPSEFDMATASFSYEEGKEKVVSNVYSYTVQYEAYSGGVDALMELCHFVYDHGYNKDSDGETKTFDELYDESMSTINYSVVTRKSLNTYKEINGSKYNVIVQGTNVSSDDYIWFISLLIYKLS